MATFAIQAIKNNNNSTLSFGTSKDGKSITLTGTIYDCDFETKVRSGREVKRVNVGDKYYGVTAVVMIPKDQADELMNEVQTFLDTNKEMGVSDPKVGLVFEVRTLGKPAEGIHPVYNTKSLNVIVQRSTFLNVEVPEEIFSDEDELDEITAEAAQISSDRSKESLVASVKRRLGLIKSDELEIEEEDKVIPVNKKRSKKKTAA